MELLPTKSTFSPEEPIEIEVRDAEGPPTVALWQLDRQIAAQTAGPGERFVRFAPCDSGGYGVEAEGKHTAFDVLPDPLLRPRYGFVSRYEAGREPGGVVDNFRRLHLNAVQFYDWMFRHAELLPPQDDFEDALGRRISLQTVRRLAAAFSEAGALPMAYAAVYAVGRDDWETWKADGLYRNDGSPWTLGDDFLWNVDPTSERWLNHLTAQLRGVRDLGFSGFHLDQYGSPKRALRVDENEVDLSAAFPALIDRLAAGLPGARLIFNNVNDFPTWATASTNQDAIYIEVWPPHDRLSHLADLVARARTLAPEKPVILAAYLSTYAEDERAASAAEELQLATVFSHGGTVLLHGEEDAALTEAYYVTHKRLDSDSQSSARRYFDFAVRYGDLLFDPEAIDVTRTHTGGSNEEVRIEAPVPTATDCRPEALWTRVIRTSRGLVVSLIDLSGQQDDLWDAPKNSMKPLTGVRLSVQGARRAAPTFFAASPGAPRFQRLSSGSNGVYDTVAVPPFRTWSLIWIPDA